MGGFGNLGGSDSRTRATSTNIGNVTADAGSIAAPVAGNKNRVVLPGGKLTEIKVGAGANTGVKLGKGATYTVTNQITSPAVSQDAVNQAVSDALASALAGQANLLATDSRTPDAPSVTPSGTSTVTGLPVVEPPDNSLVSAGDRPLVMLLVAGLFALLIFRK